MDRRIKQALGLTILAIPGIVAVITLLSLVVLGGATQGLLWCLGLKEATLGSKGIDISAEEL